MNLKIKEIIGVIFSEDYNPTEVTTIECKLSVIKNDNLEELGLYTVNINLGSRIFNIPILEQMDDFGVSGYGKEIREKPMQYTIQVCEYIYFCIKQYIEIKGGVVKLKYTTELPIFSPLLSSLCPWEGVR